MANKCTSCGNALEVGSTFCQNCGTAVTTNVSGTMTAPDGVMGRVERAVYFRVARVFSWVLLVAAIIGFFYSVALAIGSIGDLIGGKQTVSKEEVQAAIASGRKPNAPQNESGVPEASDPKLIGEYETELAQLVLLFSQEQRKREGGDEQVRAQAKQIIQRVAQGIRNQIVVVREARDLLTKFEEKDRNDALQYFLRLTQHKEQLAAEKQIEARAKFAYLGGAALMTAMLITLVSMVLVLLTIERNTRTK